MMGREMKHRYRLLALTAHVIIVLSLAIGEVDFAQLTLSHPAFAAPAITTETLDRYLADKGSPLARQGRALVDSGRRWDVDPRLVVAIAGAESTFGTQVCAEFNAWNWFYKDTSNCSANAFDSWEEGIEQVTRGLRELYLDRGRTTIPKIAEVYTATDRETWIHNVTQFYQVELGGDPNDLTFTEPGAPRPRPAVSSAPPASPFGVGAYLGTKYDQSEFDPLARKIREAGIGWVREELRWAGVGPARGPFDWSKFQAAVQSERNAGLEVLGLLDYGPRDGWDRGSDKYVPSPVSAFVLLQWRDYVYSAAQTFRGDIRYWEIWNEPNLNLFWTPQPNVDDYLQLLRAARVAIRQADPQAKIVLGGPSQVHVSDPPRFISGQDWLEQIYERGGGSDFDIVAIHPYNAHPENVAADLRDVADVIARHPEAGPKPIWVTEIGWGINGLTEDTQADYLVRTYTLALAMPEVERIAWHALTDGTDGRYGIIDSVVTLNPRPAYRAYQAMTRFLGGATFQQQVERPGSDVYEVRFLKGDQIVTVVWRGQGGSAAERVVIQDIPSSPARIFSIYGKSQGEVPVTNGQITIEVTEQPIYVLFSTARATQKQEIQTSLWIAPYNLGVEGQGTIRLNVDGKLILEAPGDGMETHQAQKTLWLRRGCHEVGVEYVQNYSPPRLGMNLWPRPPDFDAGLPPCEKAPPKEPANTPDAPVRTFFEAMDRLDVDAALETIAPVPGYRRAAAWVLGLYKGAMDALKWDNDFSRLQYQVLDNDGRSARVRVAGTVIIRSTEDGSIVREMEDFEVEVPVSNFLIRWYIYINPRGVLPEMSGGFSR